MRRWAMRGRPGLGSGWGSARWTLIGVLLGVAGWMTMAANPAEAQASASATSELIATTQVTDTVYLADGTLASGTVLVSWGAFTTAAGQAVPAGSTSTTITNGVLSLALTPNGGGTPLASYYTVVYHLSDGTVSREFWMVPPSTTPVAVSTIKSTVMPLSVAMQTVSKSYVDTAIATAIAANGTGNGGHPVDGSPAYVLVSGDTLTGPLVLAADPTTGNEAADKSYVDAAVAAASSGLELRLAMQPTASQTVAQPTGTTLTVNSLNGTEFADQYVTGGRTNGIANAVASPDCAAGCNVAIGHNYSGQEGYLASAWTSSLGGGTHVQDNRRGQQRDNFFNPTSATMPGEDAGERIDVVSTRSAAAEFASGLGSEEPTSGGLFLTHEGLTGGNNQFPGNIEAVPYFKSNYVALSVVGTYNTMGQHVLAGNQTSCYGVGDCLIGSQFVIASGGVRDDADEGAHFFDLSVKEDSQVFQGTCSAGCTPGSTVVMVAATSGSGTQGEGRYLIDKNPAGLITGGSLVGGSGQTGSAPAAVANFSGTNFPLSVFLATAQMAPSQANNISPGTLTVAISTSGVTAGFATSTAALPASSGVACVTEPNGAFPNNFEMATYAVVDASHLTMNFNKVHESGATIAIGGLCGYGLEQTVDTVGGIRQVFPVIGSISPTSLYYAGAQTAIVGLNFLTGGFANFNESIASISRSGDVVTVTMAQDFPADLNGLTMTIAGVGDASYDGSFAVTTTGSNTLTYAETGPDGTSSGGTASLLTGGYVLYPMAEVLGVFDAATSRVDGQMTLAPNTVAWAANDPVEEPHYFQEHIAADTTFVSQTVPRMTVQQSAGIEFDTSASAGLIGWMVNNTVAATNYFGNGGTHLPPTAAYSVNGIWGKTMDAQAGEQSVFSIHCNSRGCGRWNSNYYLFTLDSAVGVDSVTFQPLTSTLSLDMRGTEYEFSPQGFSAGIVNATTINASTVNATTLNGAVSVAQLPVMGASGSGHAAGIVPDPGASAGSSRFLREYGVWVVPPATTGVASAIGVGAGAPSPLNMPQRGSLLGEYLLNEGSGTVADDTSGNLNNGTISGLGSGTTWEGDTDLSFTATGGFIQLPVALNAAQAWQFAIYAPPLGSGAQPQAQGYGEPVNFGANPSVLCGTDLQHLCLIANSLGGPKSMRFMAYTTDGTEAAEPLTAGWHIVSLLCGSNVGGVVTKTHLLYDGAEVGSYVNQGDAATCPNPTTGSYQIGGSSVLTGSWFLGKVAAAWAWSAPLSLTDAAAAAKSAMDYIKAKGVTTEFRAKVQAAPVIVGGLDSRTSGVELTPATTWLATLALTDASYTTVNLGVPGETTYDGCAMFDLMYGQQISPSSGPVIAVIWGGVNDILFSNTSARVQANSLRCMVQKAKARGARVVLATEISSEANAGTQGDAGKDALDAILRAEAYGWGVDNLADLATDPHLGADGASANTSCFPDNLHPGPGCEPYVTAVMSGAINELIGSTETARHVTEAVTYQEVAGDRFLDLTGTTAQAVSLPDCIGRSLSRQVVNLGSVAGSVAAVNGEVLAGSGALGVGARAVFVPVPGALATGGCHWERTE